MFFVGAFALLWSDLERFIDIWVEITHRAGGADHIQSNLPPTLDRELDYLKDAIKHGLVSDKLDAEWRRLLADLHHLKNFRHNLIHGAAISEEGGRFIIENWRVKGGSRTRLQTPYTMAQMLRNYERTHKLVESLRAFLDLAVEDFSEPSG